MNAGRLARTIAHLHPLQVVARPPHLLLGRAIRDVPAHHGPRPVPAWPEPPRALRRLADAERARGAARLARLPPASRLHAYEATYGLEIGADPMTQTADWHSRAAVEPYPASVRARRIAVGSRCGRQGLTADLTRAARAVLPQLELHLLGNHLLENAFALACAGAATVGAEADLWWSAGATLLAWQLPQQFLRDGGHVECSAAYHVALTAALLETIEIGQAAGREVPPLWRETAARALGWMAAVQAPDGTYPLFNDAALDAAPSMGDVLALGRAMEIEPRQVGLVRQTGATRVTHLETTGWVRADVGEACLFADAGRDAIGWQPGHTHADGLTIELWLNGQRSIVDYGVSSYEVDSARADTRATRSHNTVELDGRDSCEVWGGFRVGRRGTGSVVSCRTEDGAVCLDLEHDGYSWMPGKPHHGRTLKLGPRMLEILDRIDGADRAACSRLRFDAAIRRSPRSKGAVVPKPSVWYPTHGTARDAVLYEQPFRTSRHPGATWMLEW